jgi:effector-binding domain-containing protein
MAGMDEIINALIQNSKSSQMACIEIHNKPIFPFRYEVCIILNISAWELLFKAFILKYHPEVKVINADGTTKTFDECLNYVSSLLGKNFTVTKENIQKLYEYRCNVIHFYTDNIDILLYSLLSKNVLSYKDFLLKHFGIDIANETNLILLPIGFKTPLSPIDFLSNDSRIKKSSEAVQEFVKSIIKSTRIIEKEGLEDSIFYSFNMSLINESRTKNADVVAAITKDKKKSAIGIDNVIEKFVLADDENEEGVKKVTIDEETLFKSYYTETFGQVVQNSRKIFSDFKQNSQFHAIMRSLKNKPKFHRKRYLNILNKSGSSQDYYSKKIYEELEKHYTKKK